MSDERARLDEISRLAGRATGLRLLALFGSRARGDAAEGADWDFGYLADERFDPEGFRASTTEILGTERVDLVDLSRASALLRYRAARDGAPVYEATPKRFEDFQVEASLFWCDVEWVVRRAYDEILADLRR